MSSIFLRAPIRINGVLTSQRRLCWEGDGTPGGSCSRHGASSLRLDANRNVGIYLLILSTLAMETTMKKFTVAAGLLASCTWSYAGAGLMLGVAYDFGGSAGVTLKILSTNKQDKPLAAAGVSYFPGDTVNVWGFDVDAGYNYRYSAGTLGWDFLHSKVQAAVGYSPTKKPPAPAVTPSGSGAGLSLDRFLNDAPSSLN